MGAGRVSNQISGAAFALIFVVGCKAREALPEANVFVRSSTVASSWRVERQAISAAISHGDLWVFIEPGFDPEGRRLPGLAFGSSKGPRYGLLSGYFAPLIAAPKSNGSYQATLTLRGDEALISWPPDLSIRLSPTRAVIEGSAVILPLADKTEIEALENGAPIATFHASSSDEERSRIIRGDAVRIKGERSQTLEISALCARVTTPRSRGSTSVFVVSLGPTPTLSDPLFGIGEPAKAEEPCAPSATSTVTYAWVTSPPI